ncbi:MAG: hypothetical protein WBG91_10905, partial [Syntrophobacteria bacterium]
ARLGQDLTYGEVRFVLTEPVRNHIWCTLARFSSAWVCNVRVSLPDTCSTVPIKAGSGEQESQKYHHIATFQRYLVKIADSPV